MSAHMQTTLKKVGLAAGLAAGAAILSVVVGLSSAPAQAAPPAQTCSEAVAADLLPIPSNPRHVTLCHFTGSAGNPFVINQPSLSAAETHAGHHDDCVRYYDGSSQCGL